MDEAEDNTRKFIDSVLAYLEERIESGTATANETARYLKLGGVSSDKKNLIIDGIRSLAEIDDSLECFGCRYPKENCPNTDECKWLVEPENKRPTWDRYFLGIAIAVSARADCTRRKVGAVIVDTNHRIIGTGYNGAPAGGKSCLAGECPRGQMSKEQVVPGSSYDTGAGSCIALHAEQNALLYSNYTQRIGGTIYITCPPCDGCMRELSGSGLAKAVFYSESGHLDEVSFMPQGYIKRG